MTLRKLLVALFAMALAAAGCDGDDGDGDSQPSAPTESSTTSTTSAAAADDDDEEPSCDFGGSRDQQRAEPQGIPLVITDVEIAVVDDGCVEAVTFSIREREGAESPSLGYEVEPDEPPFVATNDEEIEVEGESFVRVTFLNGSTLDENFEQAYGGPDEIGGEDDLIVEVVKVSDFEGVSEWVVGLNSPYAFVVDDGDDDRFAVTFGVT